MISTNASGSHHAYASTDEPMPLTLAEMQAREGEKISASHSPQSNEFIANPVLKALIRRPEPGSLAKDLLFSENFDRRVKKEKQQYGFILKSVNWGDVHDCLF